MDRDVYAKLIDKVKTGGVPDKRFDMANAQFSGIQFVSTSQNRITMTFNYPEDYTEDRILQIVFAPAYIRVDSMISGENVQKTVELT